jgi:hypothetical protein
MLLEQNEASTAIKWYWIYGLATPVHCTNAMDRIDHWALLARFATGPYPLLLSGDEAAVLADWMASNDRIATAFPYLPDDEKELIRRIYRTKRRGGVEGDKRSSKAEASWAASGLALTASRGRPSGPWSWWRGVVVRIRWALRFLL